MHQEITTVIHAPLDKVFEMTTRVSDWARLLPHYESVRIQQSHPDHSILRMALYRSGIPVHWTARHSVDPDALTMNFQNLSSILRGLNVLWTYRATDTGETAITITHDFHRSLGPLTPIIERALRIFFINYSVTKTLRGFAIHLEA